MKRGKSVQKKRRTVKRAFILLISKRAILSKVMDLWLQRISSAKNPDEAFAVVLDDQGENLEAAVRQGISQGIGEFVFLRFGKPSIPMAKKVIPMTLEKIRRDFLDLDFHYAGTEL